MNPWELLAFGFGLANILLLARRSVWNYPFGMVMVAILAGVFWQSRLYAVAGLQLFFFAAQAHGLYSWWRAPAAAGQVDVRRLPSGRWPLVLAAGVALSAALALLLGQTDAAAPLADGAVAGWSLVAQFMINMRLLESWPIWVAINLLSVALYAGQALWITAALSGVYFLVALYSWWLWRAAAEGQASA